ncbi:hypothetical protein E4O04_01420 [Treponema sp. OMZ 799]|uniref:hypothetical protein n=1 Tax=Treponema sp. OMZ 799 TaxID=2563668 RepID=UPI0020A44C59|nr:hypothetical protein [Treponema sp. OMZ 799]UTC76744.1 hypothetical protein E4O04_01420 [Treponema sp. OMZ 799]
MDERISDKLTPGDKKRREQEIEQEKYLKSIAFIPYHEGFYQNYRLFRELVDLLKISKDEVFKVDLALLYALSIYEERYYVAGRKYDKEYINSLIEKYASNFSEVDKQSIYRVFNFRARVDKEIYDGDEDIANLMKDIIKNFKTDNYYLPSLNNSYCYYNDPWLSLFKDRSFELGIPLCLLTEQSNIIMQVWESEQNNDFTKIYEEKFIIPEDRVIAHPYSYKASYPNPSYLSYCYLKFIPNQKITFNKKNRYRIGMIIKDPYFNIMLIFDATNMNEYRKNKLINFIDVINLNDE